MKKLFFGVFLFLGLTSIAAMAQSNNPLVKDPWTSAQLMEPSTLISILKNPKAVKPLIFNIGVAEDIPGAKNLGAASKKENLENFKTALASLPKNTSVVVYCGCCPFSKCPNIRPAFLAMKKAGFKNGRLLNIPTNIKTDWINKGYPLK